MIECSDTNVLPNISFVSYAYASGFRGSHAFPPVLDFQQALDLIGKHDDIV